VSVKRDRRHGRLTLTVTCATSCKLGAYLMTRKRSSKRFHTQTTTRTRSFRTGTLKLHLKLPVHTASLRPQAEVVVVANDPGGTSTRVTRKIRLS
jgi:hypothetical protein